MGTRQKCDGDGWDVLYARKYLCVFSKAGVSSKTKRRMRRRRRHNAKRVTQGE